MHHSYGNIVKELDLYLVICTILHKQLNKQVGCQESQDLAFTAKSQWRPIYIIELAAEIVEFDCFNVLNTQLSAYYR